MGLRMLETELGRHEKVIPKEREAVKSPNELNYGLTPAMG
jgi:hypothetical protein